MSSPADTGADIDGGDPGAEDTRPSLTGNTWPFNGLSESQVADRVAAGLTNAVPHDSSRSLGNILRANVLTLFNAVVVSGFLLLLALGHWQDALFGLAALANSVIGTVQEFRAKRLLDTLALLQAPRTRVLRQGRIRDIPVEDVVADEVLVLRSGDQLPADAVVLHADGLEIDESLLTGESDPVSKAGGGALLSGSIVVAGAGNATATRVGTDSYANRLTAEAKRYSLVNSELRNGLNRVLKTVSWALLPIMALVINGQIQAEHGWEEALRSGTWRDAAVAAAGSVISMVPQGLVLMASVAFAVGALKLARSNVLIQELPAVEGLARVDILCLDKTGTLTAGSIVFDDVHRLDDPAPPGWERALAWLGADQNANSTARCLRQAFTDAVEPAPASTVPFSSARQWSAVSFTGHPGQGAWILGAPEVVLAADGAAHARALRLAAELAASGRRTLVLAHASLPLPGAAAAPDRPPDGLQPAVLLTFREKVRPDAAAALAYFREEGVGLRVISGDNPGTVAAIAREVGLTFEGQGFDGRMLPTDPELLSSVLEEHQVFGRVAPARKKDMVLALQRRGHVVAMTGDGVNDALALKTADIGIAMGSGAPATRAVSRLVLLDGEFARLPAVVAEGRRVIANMERVSMLFLTKTSYAVLLSVAYGVLFWEYPFLPRQLSAIDGLTIGIPAFFLALMPNTRRYVPGFLKRSLAFSIPAGLVAGAVVLAVNIYARSAGYSTFQVRTGSVIALTTVGLWVLVVLARPLNVRRGLLAGAMYAGLLGLFAVPWVRDFFELGVPAPDLLAVSVGTAVPGCLAIELIHRLQHPRRAGPHREPAKIRPAHRRQLTPPLRRGAARNTKTTHRDRT